MARAPDETLDLGSPLSQPRGARRSRPLETLDVAANTSGDFARMPFDDGETARAAGRALASLGGALAKLAKAGEAKAEAAAVQAATDEGARAGQAAVTLPQGGGPTDAAAIIRQFEGFRSSPYWDVNAHRVGYGSDTVTLASGQVARVTPAMTVSREDAERDLARRISEFSAAAAKQVGEDAWANLAPSTQAALTSVAYNYGRLPARIIPAVKTGDPAEIANAVRGLGGDNGGINARRRNSEADIIQGRAAASAQLTPVQLRRDGTPQGDAYDAAVLKTGGYRAEAAMKSGLAELGERFAGDPEGFEREAAKLRDGYVQFFGAVPELQATADATFELNAGPVRRRVLDARDQKASDDLKTAAAEAVTAQADLLEKQAYGLGVNADADAQLAAIQTRAINTIESALDAGAITRAEAARQRTAIAQRLAQARFDGVFDALPGPAEKRAFAERLASPEMRDELLAKMSLDQYRTLTARYQLEARKATDAQDVELRVEKARLGKLLDDDLASIARSGVGVAVGGTPLAAADVARVLGEEETAKWVAARNKALTLYAATDGLDRLTADQIDARLAGLQPKPGQEGYADADALLGSATKAAADVLKTRADDPAAAVEKAFPALQDPAMRETPATLVAARLVHQAALGIPELARQPLTNAEAKRLAGRLYFYSDDDPAQQQVITGLAAQLQTDYGPYADEALAQVLRVNGVTREASQQGAALLSRIAAGERLTRADGAAMDAAMSRDQAERAMQPPAPSAPPAAGAPARAPNRMQAFQAASPKKQSQPNAAAVEYLRANPDQAEFFDRKYGQGMAEKFLAAPEGARRSRVLPDGSRETVYENGWVETARPDGTVDGRQM
jgi:GH24 family phage-related lysozyme (muramidase)